MSEAYVITYGVDPSDRLAAYKFASRSEAVRACGADCPFEYPDVPPGSGVGAVRQVVQTEADVVWHNGTLLAIFNGLTESGVKRFASHSAGVERLLKVLPQVAKLCELKPEKEIVMSEKNTAEKKKGRPPVASNHPTKTNWKRAKIREGGDSMRIAVMRNMIDAARTPAEISKLTKGAVPEDRVVPHIAATFRDLKIGYTVDSDGKYKLDMPVGTKSITDLIEEPKKAAPKPEKKAAAGKKGDDKTAGATAGA